MKRLLALLILAMPLSGETIIMAGGPGEGGTGIETLSQGWSMHQPFRNVTISAHLSNGGGSARGIAYLMRAIGPGTTCASEVASVKFDLPLGYQGMYTLFTGLDLAAGDYWLVFSKPRRGPFSYANWTLTTPLDLTTGPRIRYLGMAWVTSEERIAEYVPASDFDVLTDQFPYRFEVTGDPVPSVPRRRP
ncbi:MAG TPA: hypothetical protein VFP80_11350 [Thermoanaerobaculia bacterium]|nr:hypothetical protein [Thermoanaerobaculia bacterium]